MNKYPKQLKVVFFLLVFLLFVGIPKGNTANNQTHLLAKEGRLRVDNQIIEKGLILNGQWEFYWKELLTPQDFKTNPKPKPRYFDLPATWNKYRIDGKELGSEGFATYRLVIETGDVNELLALEIAPFYNSYKMWINGVLLAQNGKVGISLETTNPQWLTSTKAFHLEGKRIEIIVQISNFRHVNGGFFTTPKLGTYKNLSYTRELSVGIELTIFACLILFGFFFLGMYLFWRNDKSLLYFSLFCIFISYRFIGTGNYIIINVFPNAPWEIMAKLEYISMYGGTVLTLTFIAELFPKAVYLPAIRFFQYLSLFLITLTLLFPISIYSYAIVPYQGFLLGYLIYGGVICVKAQMQQYDGAIFAVISIILLLMITAIASLGYLGIIPQLPFVIQIGYLIYVFSQTFILSFRFAKAFRQVEDLKEETLVQKNNIEEKNGVLMQQKEEILQQTEEILAINESMQEKNQHITASIRYAETIQNAFLVHDEEMQRLFSDYFILYKPKDIVSGDFYWLKEIDNKIFFAVADCTGHGVPGAFMSIVGITLLNEIVELRKLHKPAEILENLHLGVVSSLKQNQSDNKDGMDISICVIEKNKENNFDITFSGAKSPIYYATNKGLEYIQGSKKRIGGVAFRRAGLAFETHKFTVPKGTNIYFASDGFQDQNNSEGKRFSSANFRQILELLSHKPMNEQQEELEKFLSEHQKLERQRDDITVVGLCL